jgi:hypothetical protein
MEKRARPFSRIELVCACCIRWMNAQASRQVVHSDGSVESSFPAAIASIRRSRMGRARYSVGAGQQWKSAQEKCSKRRINATGPMPPLRHLYPLTEPFLFNCRQRA